MKRCQLCSMPWGRCKGHGRGTAVIKPPLHQQHWLAAALMAQGYDKPIADDIATRYLLGRTLFPNERADAVRAMTTLNFAPL